MAALPFIEFKRCKENEKEKENEMREIKMGEFRERKLDNIGDIVISDL